MTSVLTINMRLIIASHYSHLHPCYQLVSITFETISAVTSEVITTYDHQAYLRLKIYNKYTNQNKS